MKKFHCQIGDVTDQTLKEVKGENSSNRSVKNAKRQTFCDFYTIDCRGQHLQCQLALHSLLCVYQTSPPV
ncbi:hypothetical protein T01_3039 [Trichinella spiralis]|uniref:Uncharacterized protein n=1 Tax=Trichinella spiralis TaxID=6334 RepID=A0A0V1AUK2_TRISP|nr:hypothetical protein T01_3039 [Trichinella spiralis]